jgi:hypothetical protein
MRLIKFFESRFVKQAFLFLLILIFAVIFRNTGSQGTWTYVFFSGAENLGLDLNWMISRNGFKEFIGLNHTDRLNYVFKSAADNDLVAYTLPLDVGYMFIIWFAHKIFFFFEPIKAIIVFQTLFHAVSSIWALGRLEGRKSQVIFFITYAINPLIIHFVTFDYLYYWQVLPALAWVWWITRRETEKISNVELISLLIFFIFCFLIRQSTLPVSLVLMACVILKERDIKVLLVSGGFLLCALLLKNNLTPWHTAFVGLGAYPNELAVELSDVSGFKHFEAETGIKVDINPIDGNWSNESFQRRYAMVLKAQYVEYASKNPEKILKNSVLNIFQGFSIGYPIGYPIFALISSFMGFMYLGVLLIYRMWVHALVLFSGVVGFAIYYPPIPAYMFGNYLILAFTFASLISKWLDFRKLPITQ